MPSSRYKLTTCLRKGCLLTFQLKSTATQMAACEARKHSRAWFWIKATKLYSQKQLQLNIWKTREACKDLTSFAFGFEDFFQQSASENSSTVLVNYQVLSLILKFCSKFQVLSFHFSKVHELLNWGKNLQREKIQLQSTSNVIISIKGLQSRILVCLVWPWYSTWAIQKLEMNIVYIKIGPSLLDMTIHIFAFTK